MFKEILNKEEESKWNQGNMGKSHYMSGKLIKFNKESSITKTTK
jgi:hypothetical protein